MKGDTKTEDPGGDHHGDEDHGEDLNFTTGCSAVLSSCSHPHFLPEWKPSPLTLSIEMRAARASVLFVSLIYIFVGLSFISDKFNSAIDAIVSKKRKVKVMSRVTGTEQFVNIPVWNEAVAHLTLFVLGNSAPEILLSVIETVMSNFKVGELAPMVILGSQFNLFVTGGICILAACPKSKKQHELRNFFVTTFSGVMAYGWLYAILSIISPGIVEPWEALLTLAFFPITVIVAFIVDREWFGLCRRLKKRLRSRRIQPVNSDVTILTPHSGSSRSTDTLELGHEISVVEDEDLDEVEVARIAMEKRQAHFLSLVKELRKKHPNYTSSKINEMAELQIIDEMPKTMGYYRMLASKGMSGNDSIINMDKLRAEFDHLVQKRALKPGQQMISFDPCDYRVMEDCGTMECNVVREALSDSTLKSTVQVNYATKDGSGVAGSDYVAKKGTLIFKPGEKLKRIPIKIIDDDVFNLDTQFYVELSAPMLVSGKNAKPTSSADVLLDPDLKKASITKIDDDHGGIFTFEQPEITFEEDCGEAKIRVVRNSGAKGIVNIPYRVIPETAIPKVQFSELGITQNKEQSMKFQGKQTEHTLRFKIVNEGSFAKKAIFRIELSPPGDNNNAGSNWGKVVNSISKTSGGTANNAGANWSKVANSVAKNAKNSKPPTKPKETSKVEKARLGEITSIRVIITENQRLKSVVDRVSALDLNDFLGSSSWGQQFVDAVKIHRSEDDEADEESNGESAFRRKSHKTECVKVYFFHVLTIFWKLLAALIPPSGLAGGWAAFVCSFIVIGGLIALVADLAVQLGCTVGLKVEMTAITLVAFGTSLPDIFASRLAAVKEEHADAALGHMVGRIGVSIYVGLGLSWTIASVKQAYSGHVLKIPVKELPTNIVLFFIFLAVSVFVLLLRRLPPVRGELGGPRPAAIATGAFFILLWVLYIALTALQSYCVLNAIF